jgi:glutamyl-tRNA synthetase
MSMIRVRFAPSPTGFLHVGGARTALFNWLYARHHGGTFVLRIEDTDKARSSPEMVDTILSAMDWLGLDHDEGPHFQSEESERHLRDVETLLADGKAYRCFCSPERLKELREQAPGGGREFVYPRTCRALEAKESAARAERGEPFAVRFEIPDDEIVWTDMVYGEKRFAGETIEDFVVLRSDGTPTYMLSVVSDDVAMRITHVIRGDDHVSNTPKQILLYRALGREVPRFAHLPLILGPDRKRLSKRHGAVSVLEYREQGYLADAMFNFLALLGWSPGGDRERMSRDELIAAFDLAGVGRSGAIFDLEKLDWLNGQYLNDLAGSELVPLVQPRLTAAGLWRDAFLGDEAKLLAGTIDLLKTRARTLDDFVERARPYLDPSDELEYEAKAAKKHLKDPETGERLERLEGALRALDRWEAEPLEQSLRAVAEETGVSAGKLIHPTRLAVTGLGVSPGIFEVLELLGRDRSLARLRRLIERLGDGPVS